MTLELLDANGNPTGITTTTSTDPAKLGFYEFRNLMPGTYGVREVQPNGWLDGKDTAGDHGGTAAVETTGTIVDRITGAVLNYGDHGLNYNFGELLPSSISGRVHADSGPDCDFDDPEILARRCADRLARCARQLHQVDDDRRQRRVPLHRLAQGQLHRSASTSRPSTTTAASASARSAATRTIELPLYSIFTGIALPSGVDAIKYDFCEKVGVKLAGNVYHDRDDDGNFDRPGEAGIAGVTLKLLDASGNDTGKRATTDSNGHYKFTNLAAGTYTVVEVQPAGWLDGKDTPGNSGGVADVSPPGDKISQITLTWGVDGIEYNFGELLPGSIAGRVHADRRHEDCDFDDPDNIGSKACRSTCSTAKATSSQRPTPNEDGEYEFDGLPPGTYSVREHQPTQYFDGGERVGSVGGASHDVAGVYSIFTGINLGSDIDAVQYDFCEKPPSSISGRIHADPHEDCDFDDPNNTGSQACGSICSTRTATSSRRRLPTSMASTTSRVSRRAITRSASISRPSTTTAASASARSAARRSTLALRTA